MTAMTTNNSINVKPLTGCDSTEIVSLLFISLAKIVCSLIQPDRTDQARDSERCVRGARQRPGVRWPSTAFYCVSSKGGTRAIEGARKRRRAAALQDAGAYSIAPGSKTPPR